MSTTGRRPVLMACELIKALRPARKSVLALRLELGWNESTVKRWLIEMVNNGMVEREIDHAARTSGRKPFVYWLSREWGGAA